MSRYRPPAPHSSPYITQDGFDCLQAEETAIWLRRRVVTAALSEAAAEGDRSENAEYIYRKKELRELDRRIRYLQKRIPELTIVAKRAQGEQIFFGATVTLECAGGVLEIRLVGSDEIDPARHQVSIDAPLSRALLGKTIDDEVSVMVNGKRLDYTVLAVSWSAGC
ncbi:MAG: GreA/GreB family elongation factor [Granulosicoccus sp.]